MTTKNAKKCCNNCKHFDRGLCTVLNDVLLIMVSLKDSDGNSIYDYNYKYSLIIKDKYISNYYCNKYISKI